MVHRAGLRLSVVVVCRDNPADLQRTLSSIRSTDREVCDVVIVDGSRKGPECGDVARELGFGASHRREPDRGIFDAMNRGIVRAEGDCINFMNSGDAFHPAFSARDFLVKNADALRSNVVIARGVFTLGSRRFVNLAREDPVHQAVFFPIEAARANRYDESFSIGADSEYVARLVEQCGATFVDELVCEFELGGASTAPASLAQVRRLEADHRLLGKLDTLPKRLDFRLRMGVKLLAVRAFGFQRVFLVHAALSRRWQEVQ